MKTVLREIVFDTETTGLSPENGDRLVEIGAVELINHIPTGRTYHQYINPERSVPEEVVAVHGLTEEFLKDYPVFAEVAAAFCRVCRRGRHSGGAQCFVRYQVH